MASVLSVSTPDFDKHDLSETVKSVCNYNRNMQETLDFMLGQITRSASGVQDGVETLKRQYDALAARVAALEQAST